MGLRAVIQTFKVTQDAILQLDDVQRALAPFLNNRSETVRLCIGITHMMLSSSAERRSMLRVLQTLVRMNKAKARSEDETREIKRRFDLAQEHLARYK
jgi:hypothetical protein